MTDLSILTKITERWRVGEMLASTDGAPGFTFAEAKADVDALLSLARKITELEEKIYELQMRLTQRNAAFSGFLMEVQRLAQEKYADWLEDR